MTDLISIIFIDDHVRYRKTVIQELKEHNIFTIGEADDGEKGLNLMETVVPEVVVLDLEMPVMDGSRPLIL